MAEEKREMTPRSKRGLGRGLGALFESEADPGQQSGGRAAEIEINRLEPNRDQPRRSFNQAGLKELADSIRDQGVVTPLIVTPSQTPEHYTIVAGERRWRAAALAGLKEVRIIHGKGTGALREAVTNHLKKHRQVKGSRMGEYNEGGTGVTVAALNV